MPRTQSDMHFKSGSCPLFWKVLISGMCSLELRSGGKLNKFRIWLRNLNLLFRGGWSWMPRNRNSHQTWGVLQMPAIFFVLARMFSGIQFKDHLFSLKYFSHRQPQRLCLEAGWCWTWSTTSQCPVNGRWWTPVWLFILRIISSPSECRNSWQLCKALWLYHFL